MSEIEDLRAWQLDFQHPGLLGSGPARRVEAEVGLLPAAPGAGRGAGTMGHSLGASDGLEALGAEDFPWLRFFMNACIESFVESTGDSLGMFSAGPVDWSAPHPGSIGLTTMAAHNSQCRDRRIRIEIDKRVSPSDRGIRGSAAVGSRRPLSSG